MGGTVSLQEVGARLGSVEERGMLAVLSGAGAASAARELAEAAREAGLEVLEVDAAIVGRFPDGVARACAPVIAGEPGRPLRDRGFCEDAVGASAGAREGLQRLADRWSGGGSDELLLPPDDALARTREAELLARILRSVGEVAPRLVLLSRGGRADGPSALALRSLLLSGEGAGWAVVLVGEPGEGALARAVRAVREADEDPESRGVQAYEVVCDDGSAEDAEADHPALPSRGTAVELLQILLAAGRPLPTAVVGTTSFGAYRGRPPRAGWQDLEALLESGCARLHGELVSLHPSVHARRLAGEAGLVAAADRRALLDALAEVAARMPVADLVHAELAAESGGADAAAVVTRAARRALARGDAESAAHLLGEAFGLDDEGLELRARATLLRGDAAGALRLAEELSGPVAALVGGLALFAQGRFEPAAERLEEAARAAAAEGRDDIAGAAWFGRGQALELAGAHVRAVKAYAGAVESFDRAGDDGRAARAYARRAVSMAKAGAPERGIRELKHAMERVPDVDAADPAALDVRIAMGVVLREHGQREKARTALGLAAEKAAAGVAPLQEAEARILLARFHLEAVPATGEKRGVALSEGREAAEAALRLTRAAAEPSLEAEAEAILGELAWRSEDWGRAAASLERQQRLWKRAGQAGRQVDVLIRRGRLAARSGDWDLAFRAAVQALTEASRRRMNEAAAQAQLLRGEALEELDRGSEALDAYGEAQRLYASLGEGFRGHAEAAQERARRAIERSRG